jgi:nucleoside-diphosphate-sugar epimerase
MHVLVTGGNGFLGHHLIDALERQGASPVSALVLPGEDATRLAARGVRILRGDIRDAGSLTEALQGVDLVFNLAGLMGVWRPYADYHAVNVDGAVNVCRAAATASARRIVHVSSWTVYGMACRGWVEEDADIAPISEPYARSTAAGDRALQRLIAEEQVPIVIVRPGTFFGPGDRLHFARIADRLRTGRGVIVGSGNNLLPFVYIDDVVQGLMLAGFHEGAVGRTYNITTDAPLTQRAFLAAIAEDLGLPAPHVHAPYGALYAVGAGAEAFAYLMRSSKQPILTRLGVKVFGDDNRHSIARARRELGYAPKVPVREGIRRSSAWYRGATTAAAPALPQTVSAEVATP